MLDALRFSPSGIPNANGLARTAQLRQANWRPGPLIRLSPEKLPTLIEQARTSYFLILVSRFGLLRTFAPSHLENRIQREVCYVSLLRLQGFGSQFPVFAYRWILLSVVKDQGALSDIPDWREQSSLGNANTSACVGHGVTLRLFWHVIKCPVWFFDVVHEIVQLPAHLIPAIKLLRFLVKQAHVPVAVKADEGRDDECQNERGTCKEGN